MRSKKFVLDTNVWISYFISKNYDTISFAVNKRKAIIPVCLELFAELERVLQYPHLSKLGISTKDALRFVKDIGTFYTIQQPIKKHT
ncbi:MAG: putative toxin-antitoxin system toxin component, PIN family [Chitinophagales bacterium]|nr:putative toxin-antitoxin system toxin component, PIN family [Chitinophagales bacterium]